MIKEKILEWYAKRKMDKFLQKMDTIEEQKKDLKIQIINKVLSMDIFFQPFNDDGTPMTRTDLEKYTYEDLYKFVLQLRTEMNKAWGDKGDKIQ